MDILRLKYVFTRESQTTLRQRNSFCIKSKYLEGHRLKGTMRVTVT